MKQSEAFTGLLIMALIGFYQDQWRALTPAQRTLVIEDVKRLCTEQQLGIRDAIARLSKSVASLEVYAVGLHARYGGDHVGMSRSRTIHHDHDTTAHLA